MTALIAAILEWILSKILSFVGSEIRANEQNRAIEAQAKADQQTAQDAKTPEEISAAGARIASDTFKQ